MIEKDRKTQDNQKKPNNDSNNVISHYKGKFQDSIYVKPSKPPKQNEPVIKK